MKAQEWLAQNYSDQKTRTIYLNQPLAGVLDCSEYKKLEYIFISSLIDSSKLEIKKGSYWEWGDSDNEWKIKETNIILCLSAQTWLDQNYPSSGTCQIKEERKSWDGKAEIDNFGKTRKEIKKLDISGKGLEGNCDLSDFQNCEELDCFDNCLTNLKVNNCGKLKKINCSNNQLTTLNLSNLAELEELWCSNNYLIHIIYPPQLEKITELDISNNHFSPSNLTIFSQWRNLKRLDIGNRDKNKINQNIYNRWVGSCEPLKELDKLERLDISNTDLDSGWEYLPDSLGGEIIEIFKGFYYGTELRPNCKLAQNKVELEKEIWADIHQDFVPKYKKDWLNAGFNKEQTKKFLEEWSFEPKEGAFIGWFLNFKKLDLAWACENEEEFRSLRNGYEYFGTCPECQQPNTSYKWCQSCNAKHFQEDFCDFKWNSGNTSIDSFILKCQLEATSPWNVLEWIPYKRFWDIEPITKGGFGMIEKAKWWGGPIERWDNKEGKWKRKRDYDSKNRTFKQHYKTVALKTLSNSQNLNQEFLAELTLYKMFRSSVSQMVPCYGISQDPEGNYIMVMEYMREGNLREYLRKNYRELKFYSDSGRYGNGKLDFLQQISQGLKDIHRKKLVHRDFHSGNIVVDEEGHSYDKKIATCRITDLGLSKPVNETETESKIYGLMPYMAPEVLRGERYTPAADIYSLGMVLYELITCLPPYAEQAHDTNLALKILQGIRPQFLSQVKYPQLLVDLINQCWETEPNKRPTAREVSGVVGRWFEENGRWLKKNTELYQQVQEAESWNETLPEEIKYPTYHSSEVWHSKPINTQQITDLLTSQGLTLDLGSLNIQNPQEESSTQAQIQIPPKQNQFV